MPWGKVGSIAGVEFAMAQEDDEALLIARSMKHNKLALQYPWKSQSEGAKPERPIFSLGVGSGAWHGQIVLLLLLLLLLLQCWVPAS